MINFFGDDVNSLIDEVKKFGEENKLENVALVVTNDTDRFNVNREAEITVMHYRGKKVAANHAIADGGLNEKVSKEILTDIEKIIE